MNRLAEVLGHLPTGSKEAMAINSTTRHSRITQATRTRSPGRL